MARAGGEGALAAGGLVAGGCVGTARPAAMAVPVLGVGREHASPRCRVREEGAGAVCRGAGGFVLREDAAVPGRAERWQRDA